MPGLNLGLGLGLAAPTKGVGPPPGFSFVVDEDGEYLVDDNGLNLITEA